MASAIGLRHPASASCLGRHSRLAGRCPNNSSLFPPLAAVVVVAAEKLFIICKSGKSADFPDLLFHGRGRNGKQHLQRRFLRKRGAAGGDTPSVIACGDATFPKGTAFGSGGKVFGIAQRRPLGGAGERSEPEGVAFGMAGKFPATPPLLKKQLWKIRRFSRVANIKIFFPLFMRKANAERIPNRFRQSSTMHKAPEGVSPGGFAML